MVCNLCGATYVLQLPFPNLKLSSPPSVQLIRNLVCKTRAAAIAMTARRWLAHRRGRDSAHARAQSGQAVWRDRRGR
eukprot:1439082-Pyramimonas_sp.AAC.1